MQTYRNYLKNTETAKNAKAAANEIYCGNVHLRWLKPSDPKLLSKWLSILSNVDLLVAAEFVPLFVHGWSDKHVNYFFTRKYNLTHCAMGSVKG